MSWLLLAVVSNAICNVAFPGHRKTDVRNYTCCNMCSRHPWCVKHEILKQKVLKQKFWNVQSETALWKVPTHHARNKKRRKPKVRNQELWHESCEMEVPKPKLSIISSETEVMIPKLRIDKIKNRNLKYHTPNLKDKGCKTVPKLLILWTLQFRLRELSLKDWKRYFLVFRRSTQRPAF